MKLARSSSPNPTLRHRRQRFGGSSIEYILIITVVVIPLAMLVPTLMRMIAIYSHRITWNITLPFG